MLVLCAGACRCLAAGRTLRRERLLGSGYTRAGGRPERAAVCRAAALLHTVGSAPPPCLLALPKLCCYCCCCCMLMPQTLPPRRPCPYTRSFFAALAVPLLSTARTAAGRHSQAAPCKVSLRPCWMGPLPDRFAQQAGAATSARPQWYGSQASLLAERRYRTRHN